MILQFQANRPRAERTAFPLESELINMLRTAREPDRIVAAARAAFQGQVADRVTMYMKRLHRGPRRTFWQSLPAGSGYESFAGRVFESAEEVNGAAVAMLGELDQDAELIVGAEFYGEGEYGGFLCFVERGKYRVDVHRLPKWMQRDWCALVAKANAAEGGER